MIADASVFGSPVRRPSGQGQRPSMTPSPLHHCPRDLFESRRPQDPPHAQPSTPLPSNAPPLSEHDPRDLVVIALAGVQRYITESRTTADAANASDIMARLAAEAATQLKDDGAELVIPSKVDPATAPNRIVALAAK